jgi:uncharacterized protein YciI
MSEFLYLIHPFRDGFLGNPTDMELGILEEHFTYLKQAAGEGIVVLAGPCTDETFGLVVFRAADEAAAEQFMFNDPAVKKNVMLAELHPLRISVRGE